MKKIGILGSGGHAKVVIDIINEINNYIIIGIFDDNKTGYIYDIPIIGKINEILIYKDQIDCFIIAIGNDMIRKKIYENNIDLYWETLIHPKSIVSKKASIECGSIVCAGAIIQTEVKIGKHCIINTGSSIDHESIINDFTSICPKATICGQVKIGSCTFIGASVTIIQCLNIGNNCIVGAGSVIIRDINDFSKVVGNPGKNIITLKI